MSFPAWERRRFHPNLGHVVGGIVAVGHEWPFNERKMTAHRRPKWDTAFHSPDRFDYDDSPAGNWIVYYEPPKVPGTKGYFAIAKVQEVKPGPALPRMYLALIEPGSYLEFASPVPFSGPDGVIERGVLTDAGRMSGRAQAAVRPISPMDFERIISLGLEEANSVLPRLDTQSQDTGFAETETPFVIEQVRDRVSYLTSRIVRDRVFRQLILRAYDARCAVTGLKLINEGGRAEVDAAHIQPVHSGGPDIVSNGLALSGTAHWMFDRRLIGLSDDLEILISRQVNDPDRVRNIVNRTGRAIACSP